MKKPIKKAGLSDLTKEERFRYFVQVYKTTSRFTDLRELVLTPEDQEIWDEMTLAGIEYIMEEKKYATLH